MVGMTSSRTLGHFAAVVALAATSVAFAQAPAPPMTPPSVPVPTPAASPAPEIKDLGGGRYQLGAIVVDRSARRFTVPGRVLHLDDAPLEYIAVTRAGMKAYESLLELDSRGTEFNLACILLGLEPPQRGPSAQFDRKPPQGPAVQLAVRWQAGGTTVTKSVQEVLNLAARPRGAASPPPTATVAPPPEEWAYAGSFVSDGDGRFVADATGTLVGFVHDPASIIEHRTGLGIGAYGSVQGNPEVLPPVGSAIELIVSVPQDGK
jgi:hypothetical protein